jgi:competence protein ComFC
MKGSEVGMAAINPQRILGKWRLGFALDFHTTSSTPIGYNASGHMQFDTVRPEIAELLFQLKYRGDRTAISEIAASAAPFITENLGTFDFITPAPASTIRAIQPVDAIAAGIAELLKIPVAHCVTTTRQSPQLKNIIDPAERAALQEGLYTVANPRQTSRRHILLFDDLYRSGSTLNATTEELINLGQAARVDVLTITRTRSNQ